MFGFSVYTGVLFVHVVTAMTLVGSTLMSPFLKAALLDARSVAELKALAGYANRSMKWKPLMALVLVASGVYLGSVGWWAQPWFYAALAAWFANMALGGGVIRRSATALGAAVSQAPEGAIDAGVDALRRAKAWSLGTALMMANDLATLYLMFTKPELVGSIVLLVGANAVALAVAHGTSLRNARRPTLSPAAVTAMGVPRT
jgi:hypothetical protein